jgi:hypothetical protein
MNDLQRGFSTGGGVQLGSASISARVARNANNFSFIAVLQRHIIELGRGAVACLRASACVEARRLDANVGYITGFMYGAMMSIRMRRGNVGVQVSGGTTQISLDTNLTVETTELFGAVIGRFQEAPIRFASSSGRDGNAEVRVAGLDFPELLGFARERRVAEITTRLERAATAYDIIAVSTEYVGPASCTE